MKFVSVRWIVPILFLAACASHRPKAEETAAAPAAPAAVLPAGAMEVPPPINPELIKQIELLRGQGLELLYSKDPSIRDPKLAFEKLMHAAQLGDPVSMDHVGGFYAAGSYGVEKSCAKALEWFEKSAQLGYPMAMNNLAYTLVSCPDRKLRDPAKAEELMKTLFQNTPGLLAALDTYAAVLAEGGDFAQAAKTLEVVIDLADFTQANPERVDEFKDTLKLYRSKKLLPASKDSNGVPKGPAKGKSKPAPKGKAKEPTAPAPITGEPA